MLNSNYQAPEAPIDNRSLFEKLQEQKDLKEMQWQEEHAFKNNTFNKALEEDEAQFLDAVDAARQLEYIKSMTYEISSTSFEDDTKLFL